MLSNLPEAFEGGSRNPQAELDLDHLLKEIFPGPDRALFCSAETVPPPEAEQGRIDFSRLQPNDFAAFAFDLVPRRFTLENSRIKIEDNLARLVRNFPDVELPEFLKKLAGAINSVEINAGEHAISIRAQGQHKLELDMNGQKLAIDLKDPSFQIKFDQRNPNRIEIANITGAETRLGRLTGMVLELRKNDKGEDVLRLQVTHAAPDRPNTPAPQTPEEVAAARLGQLRAAFERTVANNISFDIPLDENGLEAARQVLKYGRQWSEAKDLFQVLEVLGDHADLPLVKDVLKDITSVTRSGDNGEKLEILRKGPKTIELGSLQIKLDEKIQIKLEKEQVGQGIEGTAIKFSDISGISAKLPLPQPILDKLGIPADVRLTEVRLSERKADGTRELCMKTADHGCITLSLDANGRPVMKDGNLSVDVDAVVSGMHVPCRVTFNPEKAAQAGPNGPDFKIEFKGQGEGLCALLEKVVGGDLGPASQLAIGVKEIIKEGDKVTILREKNTSSEFGGLVVDAAERVEFKIENKNGLVLKDVKGISYKVKVDLGWLQNALDLGNETKSTAITNLEVSEKDGNGRQKIVVRGDGPFAAIRVDLKDGKIATDPNDNNRGSIYCMIRQAKTDEERRNNTPSAYIAVVLKVDGDGNNAMTTGEMTKAAAEAVYMVINKDKFRGYEPVLVEGKELFTTADGDASKAPIVHIGGYDIKVRMNLPFYRGGRGVVLYHDGSHIRAVAPNGDEWELRQRGGYRQSRDKYDADKTYWVKVEGSDLNWQCHGDRDQAPIVTIPGPEIDVRMHLPYYSGAGTVRIGLSDGGQIHCFGPQGSEWELRQVGDYNQQRDARNPNKTVWVRIK